MSGGGKCPDKAPHELPWTAAAAERAEITTRRCVGPCSDSRPGPGGGGSRRRQVDVTTGQAAGGRGVGGVGREDACVRRVDGRMARQLGSRRPPEATREVHESAADGGAAGGAAATWRATEEDKRTMRPPSVRPSVNHTKTSHACSDRACTFNLNTAADLGE